MIMTLRYAMACVWGIGVLLAAGACASAGPLAGGGPRLDDRMDGYELVVLVDGAPAPTFSEPGGTYVMGQLGARYTLRIINHTGRRIEAVVSVDGRDVVDGRPADFRGKRGYLVPGWGQVDIDGWRLSTVQAAAFRFSTVARPYAGRTGSAREVGVIGAAIFPERFVPRPRPPVLRRPDEDAARESWSSGQPWPAPPSAAPASPPAADESEAQASAGAGAASRSRAARGRSGLGTEFGEAVTSPVEEVAFVRANASRPAAVLGVRYNDHDGLLAMGVDVDGGACTGWGCDHETTLRETASPFPLVERRFAAPPPCWRGTTCPR
jgi:hypothetical protein